MRIDERTASGAPASRRLLPGRLDAAFATAADQVRDGRLPAQVVAVARREGLVRSEAFGRPRGDAVTVDSAFMIASVTKPIVATAVMQLVDDGLLDLDLPVRRYLPEFDPPAPPAGTTGGDAITTRHLLTHTSGVEDYETAGLGRDRPRAEELYRLACTRPLLFEPGSRFQYVSNSFYVVANLVSRLAGSPYPEVLRERIFAPLGMAATGFEPPPRGPLRAPIHGLGVPALLLPQALRYIGSLAIPGGGLWSRAADLVALGRAYLCGGELDGARILSTRAIVEMARDQTAGIPGFGADDRVSHHGLGWGKPGARGGRAASPAAIEHGGATGSRVSIDPDEDLVVVVLANSWNADVDLSKAVVDAVFDALA